MINERLILKEIIKEHYLAWVASRIFRFVLFLVNRSGL